MTFLRITENLTSKGIKIFSKKKILIVATHKDDECLIAGAVISEHGHNCTILTISNSGNSRDTSFYNNKKKFGFNSISFNFIDGNLNQHIPEISGKINDHIGKIKPDIVITSSQYDLHHDHVAVYNSVKIACRPYLCYQPMIMITGLGVSSYESSLVAQPNVFFKMSKKNLSDKVLMMNEYGDQLYDGRCKDRIYSQSSYYGGRIGVDYAEPFILERIIAN